MRNVQGNYIIYNGKSSIDYDIIIAKNPPLTRARRKYERVSVPGKNGDIYFIQDAWENYDYPYELFIGDGSDNSTPEATDNVDKWLSEPNHVVTVEDYLNLTIQGYHRLIDSYEPNVIRLATLVNGFDVNNMRGLFGRLTVIFNCRPERFTADAFTPIEVESGDAYFNPTFKPAKPCIKVYGSGSGSVVINDYVINITGLEDYLYIDSDSQNCFRGLSDVNQNNKVSLTKGYPLLDKYDNERNLITYSGGITKVELIPRWWHL